MMRQLLAGAAAMHGHGIVHRNIEPGNILVCGVKICDFGIAKSMAEKEPPLIGGFNGYRAPELLLFNMDHDTLVDVWSLGCVMAELLTGQPLFVGKCETEQLYKIFNVLGVPGKRACKALKAHQCFADEVQLWQVGHRNRLRELVPNEVLSKEGFEVLKGLLTCDPKKRLTAAAALRCSWFTDNVDDPAVPATAVSEITADTAVSEVTAALLFPRTAARPRSRGTGLADGHVIGPS